MTNTTTAPTLTALVEKAYRLRSAVAKARCAVMWARRDGVSTALAIAHEDAIHDEVRSLASAIADAAPVITALQGAQPGRWQSVGCTDERYIPPFVGRETAVTTESVASVVAHWIHGFVPSYICGGWNADRVAAGAAVCAALGLD